MLGLRNGAAAGVGVSGAAAAPALENNTAELARKARRDHECDDILKKVAIFLPRARSQFIK